MHRESGKQKQSGIFAVILLVICACGAGVFIYIRTLPVDWDAGCHGLGKPLEPVQSLSVETENV